jgi:CheY-like chemotaxis protein
MDNNKKILLIEDEKPLLDTYAEILSAGGYSVIKAPDGYKGLEELATNKDSIGLIFLDLMMQGMDGLEVLRNIKNDQEKYGSQKIIILTNMTSERVIKEAFAVGASSYLIKSELEAEDMLNEARVVIDGEADQAAQAELSV